MEIVAALAGAVVGSLVTIIWDRIREPKRLLKALRAELAANEQICHECLSVNRVTLAALGPRTGADEPIDDDSRVFVVSPINIPLETWVNQDSASIFRSVPIEELLEYKTAVMRVEYLVDRHRAFRFRPNFIQSLVDAHEKLVQLIEQLQGAIG
jgi:hypothetical protein